MMVIEIYRHHGTWAFTDPFKGLENEPFVAGIPEIIDEFIEKFSDKTQQTHRITFSASDFPGSHGKLTKTNPEQGGAWYKYGKKEGWLCPATLHYFPEHPEELFVRFS
jgi:hypothetical protein